MHGSSTPPAGKQRPILMMKAAEEVEFKPVTRRYVLAARLLRPYTFSVQQVMQPRPQGERERFVEEVLEWCTEQFGPKEAGKDGRWSYQVSTDMIGIASEVDATAFRLKWC
jgi:hypothetical protein